MTEQIGLHKFKLTQKRYKDGAFYLSVVLDGEQVKALDGRFFVEEGNELTPTKNGFRIPIEKLDAFGKALSGDLREIDDTVLFENKSFRFHIRYLNDKYGEAIDLRKYKTTNKYSGWDRSGVRLKFEDVATMRDWLSDFDTRKVASSCNLFLGKDIGRKKNDDGTDSTTANMEVSPAIKEILDY